MSWQVLAARREQNVNNGVLAPYVLVTWAAVGDDRHASITDDMLHPITVDYWEIAAD
jgi:hypothetical protein